MNLNQDNDFQEILKTMTEKAIKRMRISRCQEPADLLLRNCRVVNVQTSEIIEADIAVAGDRIAAVRPAIKGGALETIDCQGAYALPGFVEPHMHLETTLVSPRQLARAIVPLGTTSLFVDGTDVSYVAGPKSVRTLIDSTRGLPLRVFLEAPSYSAFLPGIQTTGGAAGLKECLEMLSWPETVSLGEIVAAIALSEDQEYLQKILAYKAMGKRLNGHVELESEEDLDAFISLGITDDHTIENPEQILTRLRRGLTLFLVEAPGRRNLSRYVRHIIENNLPTDHICFCIDNISIIDIVEGGYGYLDYLVQVAVSSGLDPIKAIQMATINTARYFKMDGDIGSLSPGRFADILLLDNLTNFKPERVFANGKLVAEDGHFLNVLPAHPYPDDYLNTINLHSSLSQDSLLLKTDWKSSHARVRVLELQSDNEQASNHEGFADLPIRDGVVQPDLDQDIIRLCVVERYGQNGNVGFGFCKGTGMKEGAIATSLSISDSNIVVLGVDTRSMWAAIQEVRHIQGGVAVSRNNDILGSCPLPLGGQMADIPFETLLEEFHKLIAVTHTLGCHLTNPILTLASTVLMSVPDLGLIDCGYVNGRTGKLCPTLIEPV